MTATCAACGAPLTGQARFCNNCGAPAGDQPIAVADSTPAPAPAMAATEPIMECHVSLLKYLLRPRLWLVWAVVAGAIVGGVLLGSAPAVLVVMGVTVIVLFFWWLSWRSNKLVVYPDRIVRHQGVLNRTERTDPMWRIQDVTLEKKWYGLGWVYFETAGESSDSGFGPITNATQVRNVIYGLIRHHTTP